MIVRRIARPLLSTVFIVGGLDSLRHPAAKAPALEQLPGAVAQNLPADPVTLVRINGAVQVGAGVMLAVGKAPRLASLALAGSVVPTTVAGHAFWNVEDPAQRAAQRTQFFKNMSLLGGLLIAAVDTEGKPSLGWRGRRAARRAQDRVSELLGTDLGNGAEHPALAEVSDRAQRVVERAGLLGGEALEAARERADEALDVARDRGGDWADIARERGAELAERARVRGLELADLARERGGELTEVARERGSDWTDTVGEQAEVLGRRARRKADRALAAARDRAAELRS